MATNTTTYSFLKPTVGGDTNLWGGYLNSNWDDVDDLLDGTSSISGIDINGGSIDGTPIGAASASTGAFTSLSASGNLTVNGVATLSSATISGGSINGTAIGQTTPGAGTFNSLRVDNTVPQVQIYENDQAADEKLWRFVGIGGSIYLETRTDANAPGQTVWAGLRGTGTALTQQIWYTGNSTRMDINNSGFRLGAANARVVTILDEDTMASNRADALSTQQAIKAYVDSKAGFIASSDYSNDTDAEFTLDNTAYDVHILHLQNLIPTVDSVNLILRTSTTGGAPFDAAASDYAWAYISRVPGNNNNTDDQADGKIDITNQTYPVGSAAGEAGVSGTIVILGAGLAQDTQIFWDITYTTDTGGVARLTGGGARLAAEDVTAVDLLFDSGNIESGTITHEGVRSS